MNKKKKEKLNRDRQISRDRRNSLRRQIRDNVSAHRNNQVLHVLFISKETENMEKVLFAMATLEKEGYLINLPIIPKEDDKDFKKLILLHWGIEAQDFELIEGTNLLVVKDFSIVDNKENLVEIMVRPYNEYTWYDNKCETTLYGERIFRGKKLKDFFVVKNDLEDVFVFQDTITEILLYRIKEQKINGNDFLNSYRGFEFFGIECGNRKKHTDTAGWSTLYNLLAQDDKELQRILANEKNEIRELSDNDSEILNPKRLLCEKKLLKKDE